MRDWSLVVGLLHHVEELTRRELLGSPIGGRDVDTCRTGQLVGPIEVCVRFDLHLLPVEACAVVLGVGGSGAGWMLRLGALRKLEAILGLGRRELAAAEIRFLGRVTRARVCIGCRALETVSGFRICTANLGEDTGWEAIALLAH